MFFYCEDSFNQVYQSDMFLGASSSGNVLKVDNLRPGSILIDDSFPPVISVRDSIKRIKNKQDVLILGGGKMLLPQVHFQSTVWYIPQALISLFLNQMGKEGLPGCWLEAVVFFGSQSKKSCYPGTHNFKKTTFSLGAKIQS